MGRVPYTRHTSGPCPWSRLSQAQQASLCLALCGRVRGEVNGCGAELGAAAGVRHFALDSSSADDEFGVC